MTPVLFAFICLVQLAQGASTNSTSSDRCPPPDGTTRSLWSILGSCALTLLICVWHTVHFNVPQDKVEASLWFKCFCAFVSFLAPEAMIAYATRECWQAHKQVQKFRAEGHEWSMTHSFFAGMGGFRYLDEHGRTETIDSDKFLQLFTEKKIANPFVTVKEIRDKSKSDWLGKAILALQLVWFMLQVIVRGSKGLAITLVELDTVCMAVLSLIVIVLWWYKPLRPECPHVFYATRKDSTQVVPGAWRPEPIFPSWLTSCFTSTRKHDDETRANATNEEALSIIDRMHFMLYAFDADDSSDQLLTVASLSVTWLILGGLHLIAWNFEFPTEVEKILWRVASLVLAGGSLAFVGVFAILWADTVEDRTVLFIMWPLTGVLGVMSRALLVGLMLASLRALPCSAHDTVPWTLYIPHL